MNIKSHQIGTHLQAICHTINHRTMPQNTQSFIPCNYQYAFQSPKQSHTDIISAQLENYAVTVMWLAPWVQTSSLTQQIQEYSYDVHIGNKNVEATSPKPRSAAGFAGYNDHMLLCCFGERKQQLLWATICGTLYVSINKGRWHTLNHFQSPATASWWDTRPLFRTFCYWGADKSLAWTGRKQAWKHVRDVRDFNNIETSCYQVFFFSARQGTGGNSRHSDRNISLFPSWSG